MKTININELNFISEISTGSYAVVKKCEYKGKIYACKELYQPESFLTDKNIKKFDNLAKTKEPYIVSPRMIVQENKINVAYLSEYLDGNVMDDLKGKNQTMIIENLIQTKVNLQKMHNLGIIHCDVQHRNIIDSKFFDFDNCYYKNIKPNYNHLSDYAQKFLRKYGLCAELDIAMFNLLTYYMLTNISYAYALKSIKKENYSIFETTEQRDICRNLLLQDEKPTQKLLINTL